ncbi:MAG: hypothetical protein CYPHOPRED_001910 [Cyphobasidiales sp. Tagirdzhanova-0007]|nr:MAG: hypothetical protein CYPHOPRED_001910 [Cyphobasidiales sp. Tagirdzhanova-0007]
MLSLSRLPERAGRVVKVDQYRGPSLWECTICRPQWERDDSRHHGKTACLTRYIEIHCVKKHINIKHPLFEGFEEKFKAEQASKDTSSREASGSGASSAGKGPSSSLAGPKVGSPRPSDSSSAEVVRYGCLPGRWKLS